jgi:hypothetical protein
MTKHKRVAAILLAIMMIFTFMPSMAFADVVESDGKASVTTDETTEPIQYSDFASALAATNNPLNEGQNAVVTLLADAEYPATTYAIKLTIDLNGHKLTGVPADGPVASVGNKFCLKSVVENGETTKIVINDHNGVGDSDAVYNWEEQADGSWKVVSSSYVCDACEFSDTSDINENDPFGVTVTNPNAGWNNVNYNNNNQRRVYNGTANIYRTEYNSTNDNYEFKLGTVTGTRTDTRTRSNQWSQWNTQDGEWVWDLNNVTWTAVLASKAANTPAGPAYVIDPANPADFVRVNGVIQRKDGLPVVKASVIKVETGEVVDGVVTLSTTTNEELEKVEGLDPSIRNSAATCQEKGDVVYKAEVADPDGNVVATSYLLDEKIVPKTDHVKGALKGYKLLEKTKAVGATTEAEAIAAANGADVVKVTTETANGTTTYYYWTYGAVIKVNGTEGNINPTVTVADKNLEADGSFTYMPVFYCASESVTAYAGEVDGTAVTVKALPNATTKAEAGDGKHSLCKEYAYADSEPLAYEFKKIGQTETSKMTCTFNFANAGKAPAAYSHVSDGTQYNVTKPATCKEEGKATVQCAICDEKDVEVAIEKIADTFGAFPAGAATPTADVIDSTLDKNQTVTLNADRTEATVTATCEHPGGTYKYCTAEKHWVLQGTATPATGHNFAVVESGDWDAPKPDYAADKEDYVYTAKMVCTNKNCDGNGTVNVKYHSKKGTDTYTNKYEAVLIDKEEAGKDCQTIAKTTYTVKGVKSRTGEDIIETKSGDANTVGPHSLKVVAFNWSDDFESATASTECTVTGCTHKETGLKAEVKKTTTAEGLTTFTATYGESSESHTAYDLTGAEVTYDTSKITDGNLVEGVSGAAAQTPEVTVTLNGTVIDSKELEEVWTYDDTDKTANLTVKWAKDKDLTGADKILKDEAYAEPFKVARKVTFAAPAVTVKKGDTELTETAEGIYTDRYEAGVKWSVTAEAAIKDATVKYAVTSKKAADQAEIDGLTYDLSEVNDTLNVGTYYVYAQLSKDGFTTFSTCAAVIKVTKMSVDAYIDHFSMKQGETPSFNVVFRDYYNEQVVTVDPSEYTVTSAGGQALDALLPGDYNLLVTSDNYDVYTSYDNSRLNTVTVLTKEGKTVDQDAADTNKAADLALADANALDAADYTAASYKAVTEATKALKNAILNGSTEDIKAATNALNAAIEGLDKMLDNPMTVKTKTVKAKAKKTVKNKVGLVVKNAKGTKTFTKVSGNSKIKVNKTTGKITVYKGLKAGKSYKVKIKVKAAGTSLYKAKTVTKTVTVKVK